MEEIKYTKDSTGIIFNSVKQSDNFKITDYPRYYKNNFNYAEQGLTTITKIYNAVEFDWNGASICNKTVNSTGELLSILQTA